MAFEKRHTPEDERNVVDEILSTCDGSSSELAKRLTEETGNYFTPQRVHYWRLTGRVPPEHIAAVSKVSGVPASRIAPELFAAFTKTEKGADE